MLSAPPSDAPVLLDYVSPQGANVTHVRGVLLANAIDNLKNWGVYDRYLDVISAQDRTWLVSTLATSWVPIDAAERHYELVSRLDVSDASLEEAGERMAARVAEMYLGAALGGGGGVAAFAALLSKNDKMWDRFYQGGACVVLQPGAQEFVLEDYGNPLIRHRAFRHAYVAYMEALANRFRPRVQVRETACTRPADHALATRFRW